MAQITYIDKDDKQYVVEVQDGVNVMQAAVDNMVPGILGDCGGFCACATCHVYVDSEWMDKTGERSETEVDLLDGVEDLRPTSRLCCQIIMNEDLDGIVVTIPESQL